jgi:hypothetical protein
MKIIKIILSSLAIAVLMLTVDPLVAQEFKITKVEMTPETIILHYDLIDSTKDRAYIVNVFSSRDQFVNPLQKLRGDFGIEVRPGLNKRIEWNSKEELGTEFEGGVELEIRGRIYIPFIKFENLVSGLSMKRGVKKKLTWSGGTKQYLNFNLYKNERPVEVFPNISNTHEYDLVLPMNIKPGKGYYFVVSDSKNKDQVMKSPAFQIKRKVPLALKAVPAIILLGTMPLWGSWFSGKKSNEIPLPLGTPINNQD